jgi:hypothetical protein
MNSRSLLNSGSFSPKKGISLSNLLGHYFDAFGNLDQIHFVQETAHVIQLKYHLIGLPN